MLGKHSGRHALRQALRDLGFTLTREQLDDGLQPLHRAGRPQEGRDRRGDRGAGRRVSGTRRTGLRGSCRCRRSPSRRAADARSRTRGYSAASAATVRWTTTPVPVSRASVHDTYATEHPRAARRRHRPGGHRGGRARARSASPAASATSIDCADALLGGVAIHQTGTPLPDDTQRLALEADATLLGAVGLPEFDDAPPDKRPENGLLELRKALGVYANLRPVRASPRCSTPRRSRPPRRAAPT